MSLVLYYENKKGDHSASTDSDWSSIGDLMEAESRTRM
jgi:hypothetical protein